MSLRRRNTPDDAEGEPVPASETGYAVSDGQLRLGEDFFELDLTVDEAAVTRRAIDWHDETPKVLTESFKGGTTFRGDYPALDMVVDALKAYENYEAGIGEDKIAYDTRTAFNHARYTVREHLQDDE